MATVAGEVFSRLQTVLEEAKTDFSSDPGLFYSLKVFKLGRFIGLACDLMKSLNSTREDLGTELPEFNQFLVDWDCFLNQIEKKVTCHMTKVTSKFTRFIFSLFLRRLAS
jgi:hypothetical protein